MRETSGSDKFREKFKYFKSNDPKPSLRDVINQKDTYCDKVQSLNSHSNNDHRALSLGLTDLSNWELFQVKGHPGLMLIRNPFTSSGQRYWVKKCLEVYPRKPNRTNIDLELNLADWWRSCYENEEYNRKLQKKLRWTTLGYHHNWDTKLYSEENKSEFPQDLAELSDIVAKFVGYEDFKAQAAIVNYYHMDSTLSAHTDHSEVNLEAPLFSFSFGQSAIFLIGGKDKATEPSAIMLNSGDIVVMSKEARLCYHAVPKILRATEEPWNTDDTVSLTPDSLDLKYIQNYNEFKDQMKKSTNRSEWKRFGDYISKSRINMNVRQVLSCNQKSLLDPNIINS